MKDTWTFLGIRERAVDTRELIAELRAELLQTDPRAVRGARHVVACGDTVIEVWCGNNGVNVHIRGPGWSHGEGAREVTITHTLTPADARTFGAALLAGAFGYDGK